MPPELATTVYSAAQESLTDARWHAEGATHIEVRVAPHPEVPDRLEVSVTDDGHGQGQGGPMGGDPADAANIQRNPAARHRVEIAAGAWETGVREGEGSAWHSGERAGSREWTRDMRDAWLHNSPPPNPSRYSLGLTPRTRLKVLLSENASA
ncbi:hypothetical protein HUT19_34005 [Streptomyces sp. NA02950]|uniref:hypothetical protein n=1 Tax=Streptomyces sp. NA02950 TaxID=2742137 RepID=UPI001591CF8F|nr:hypothetical protein [Streptomyces sp. NA02950]QKV96121.1 hypothetical protein HUT19_34005 [Streptomyces sp. NA02950]